MLPFPAQLAMTAGGSGLQILGQIGAGLQNYYGQKGVLDDQSRRNQLYYDKRNQQFDNGLALLGRASYDQNYEKSARDRQEKASKAIDNTKTSNALSGNDQTGEAAAAKKRHMKGVRAVADGKARLAAFGDLGQLQKHGLADLGQVLSQIDMSQQDQLNLLRDRLKLANSNGWMLKSLADTAGQLAMEAGLKGGYRDMAKKIDQYI